MLGIGLTTNWNALSKGCLRYQMAEQDFFFIYRGTSNTNYGSYDWRQFYPEFFNGLRSIYYDRCHCYAVFLSCLWDVIPNFLIKQCGFGESDLLYSVSCWSNS